MISRPCRSKVPNLTWLVRLCDPLRRRCKWLSAISRTLAGLGNADLQRDSVIISWISRTCVLPQNWFLFWPGPTIGVIKTKLTKLVPAPTKHCSWDGEGKAVRSTYWYLGKGNTLQRLDHMWRGNALPTHSQPKLSTLILAPREDLAPCEGKWKQKRHRLMRGSWMS